MAISPITLCAAYGLISIVNNLSNKYLVSKYVLSPFFLLFAQEFLVILTFPLCRSRTSSKTLMKSLPVSIFFFGNICFGLIGMKYVNLPMYICIRKLTTPIIYSINIWQSGKITAKSAFGVLFITLGGITAGINDISSDFFGYFIVLLSVIMNTLQLIYMNSLYTEGLNIVSVYFCASIYILPVSFACCSFFEQNLFETLGKVNNYNGEFMLFVGSCSSACSNFLMILCTSKVSPIATSITGNIKDIFSMFIGILIFSDTFSFPFYLGLCFSTCGASLYTYDKLFPNT